MITYFCKMFLLLRAIWLDFTRQRKEEQTASVFYQRSPLYLLPFILHLLFRQDVFYESMYLASGRFLEGVYCLKKSLPSWPYVIIKSGIIITCHEGFQTLVNILVSMQLPFLQIKFKKMCSWKIGLNSTNSTVNQVLPAHQICLAP